MLQINPNEIIKSSRLINNSLETILNNLKYLKHSSNKNSLDYQNIDKINRLVLIIQEKSSFLNDIVNELVKITGEDIDKLIESNYSMAYYENKIINYYAKAICNNDKNDELDILDLCYGKDAKLTSICSRENFITYANSYLEGFDFEKYNLDKESVMKDLLYILNKRGSSEAHAVMQALVNNAPNNYLSYNFNPGNITNTDKYYDFNSNTINNYSTNSEIININGYDYEICQVLPSDVTNTEKLVYNFSKANVINTMRTLPDKYLKLCSGGSSNSIILTSSREAMNNSGVWSGYYKPSSIYVRNNNMIVVDIHGSLIDNEYYTQDTIIHEMAHKFDDMMYETNLIEKIFGKPNYTNNHNEWQECFNKYKNILNGIDYDGYEQFPNVNEFFGDAMVAYFKSPETVKKLCPELYELTSKMLDGEYGYSYSDRIVNILYSG